MKSYRPWSPSQSFLLPPSPEEWLPEGHLAYFILDVLEALDIGVIERVIQGKDARGERPYAPRMMLGLLIYGYCVGTCSSRRIERATYDNIAFRVIAAGSHPHFTRISDFRKRHLRALKGIFLQVLQLCQKAGLVKLGHVALDGTKMQGNASKHKAMSYERMCKTERELKQEIEALLSQAAQLDEAEDAEHGRGQQEQDIPAELVRREERLARIAAAKAILESEAKKTRAEALLDQAENRIKSAQGHDVAKVKSAQMTAAAACLDKAKKLGEEVFNDDDDGAPPTGGNKTPEGLPTHRIPADATGAPQGKAQYNFTDPDSRIQKSNGTFLQGYNCQVAVDSAHQVIVAQAITNHAADNHNMAPMLDELVRNCGEAPDVVTADTGYWNASVLKDTAHLKSDIYIALGREKKSGESASDEAPAGARALMRKKLHTKQGKAIYARRKAIVEPVHGNIKESQRYRRFLLRGMECVAAEFSLLTTGHNLLKLFRSGIPLQSILAAA
jgi:transposase